MTENYATFDTPVKPHVGSPVTLVLRGRDKPVILMGTTFAELMDALRPFCTDGKIFPALRHVRETANEVLFLLPQPTESRAVASQSSASNIFTLTTLTRPEAASGSELASRASESSERPPVACKATFQGARSDGPVTRSGADSDAVAGGVNVVSPRRGTLPMWNMGSSPATAQAGGAIINISRAAV